MQGWYHISFKDLGDEFVFTPQIPRHPARDIGNEIIEDVETPRTSWAPSLDAALNGLGPETPGDGFVYFTQHLQGQVNPSEGPDDLLSSPAREGRYERDNDFWTVYPEMYSLKRWRNYMKEKAGRDVTDDEIKALLKHHVPDARHSGEQWATKPTKARKIGALSGKKFTSTAQDLTIEPKKYWE